MNGMPDAKPWSRCTKDGGGGHAGRPPTVPTTWATFGEWWCLALARDFLVLPLARRKCHVLQFGKKWEENQGKSRKTLSRYPVKAFGWELRGSLCHVLTSDHSVHMVSHFPQHFGQFSETFL